jgi:DNA-binding MarR family transcriptional regulator
MDEHDASNGSASASQAAADLNPAGAGTSGSLLALFTEVTALANQLRKTTAFVNRQDNSPQAGWSILRTLGRLGPQTVPDIARARALSRQNIQILVNRLEAQGYVAVTPNPAHKRSGLVELAERGRRLLAGVMERESATLEALVPHVSRSRLVPAARLLRQLRELLAGKGLLRAELAEERPARKPARMPGRVGPGRTAAPPSAELPIAHQPIEQNEGEFPVNLL